MSGLAPLAATVCAASLVCALLSHLVTDGGAKKIVNLVMGAFVVCSLLVPVKNAVEGFTLAVGEYPSAQSLAASADEACDLQVIFQTEENLGSAARDIMLQNGIEITRAEFILALTDENRIIISSACIYIGQENACREDEITRLTQEHFGITPSVITE